MKVILVGDEREMGLFRDLCDAATGFTVCGLFHRGEDARSFLCHHSDVAFAMIDSDLPDTNALKLAAALRELRPDLITMFAADRSDFVADAIRQKADYILFKPLHQEDVLDALERAKLLQARQRKRYSATLFGSFDFSVGESTVRFQSSKARELMALLLCYRGREVSIHSIVDALWENSFSADVRSVGYRKVIKSLSDTLRAYGAEELLVRTRGYCRIREDLIDCDYFQFLQSDPAHRPAFSGVFLPEYAWAEQYIYPMLQMQNGG